MEERRGVCRVLGGNLSDRELLEDPCVYGRIILKWIFRKWVGSMDSVDLAQDRDRLRSLVNMTTNFLVL
jgi:hypothetical protein